MNDSMNQDKLKEELFYGLLEVYREKILKIEYKPRIKKKGVYNKIKFKTNLWLLHRFPLRWRFLFKSPDHQRMYRNIRVKFLQNIDDTYERDFILSDFAEDSPLRIIFETFIEYMVDHYDWNNVK